MVSAMEQPSNMVQIYAVMMLMEATVLQRLMVELMDVLL